MDKNTLSNYGWIVICILVLSVMIALATPFGKFIATGFEATYTGFSHTVDNAFDTVLNNTGDNDNTTSGGDTGNTETEKCSFCNGDLTYTPNFDDNGNYTNTHNIGCDSCHIVFDAEDPCVGNVDEQCSLCGGWIYSGEIINSDQTAVYYSKDYNYADSDWNFIYIETGAVITKDVVVYLGGMQPTAETLNNSIYEFNGNILTIQAENMTPYTQYALQFEGGNYTNTPQFEQLSRLDNETETARSIHIGKYMNFCIGFSCLNEEGNATEFIQGLNVSVEFSNGESCEMTTDENGDIYIEKVRYTTDGINVYDTVSANIKVYNTNNVLVFETTIDDLMGNYGQSYTLDRSVLTAE